MANPLYTSVDPRIIDVHWFTPGQVPVIPGTLGSVFNQLNSPVEFCIGVVVVEDEITHERKGYIGIGNGIDEKADIRRVLDWGSPIIPRIIEEITADMGLSQSHADELMAAMMKQKEEIEALQTKVAAKDLWLSSVQKELMELAKRLESAANG